MTFELTILGCSSAMPVHGRFMSAQVLNVNEKLFLIDCAEGTQIRLADFNISKNKIDNILISHLHGDHIFGLPGLIGSMSMLSRKKPLNIFGPPGLEHFLNTAFEISDSYTGFDLNIHTIDTTKYTKIYDDSNVEVYSFPLQHRIPTAGYKIVEKDRQRNIKPAAIEKYSLDFKQIQAAKAGDDVRLSNGQIIKNIELTKSPKKKRSFAYCSDTKYSESIIPYIKGIDLLYHEATYMKGLQDKARERYHSTTVDAATIAKKAGALKLIIGHYSSRYKDLEMLLEEAKSVFPNTELAIDGKRFSVKLEEDEQ